MSLLLKFIYLEKLFCIKIFLVLFLFSVWERGCRVKLGWRFGEGRVVQGGEVREDWDREQKQGVGDRQRFGVGEFFRS